MKTKKIIMMLTLLMYMYVYCVLLVKSIVGIECCFPPTPIS